MINIMIVMFSVMASIVLLFAIFCYFLNKYSDKDGLEKMLTKDNWRKE